MFGAGMGALRNMSLGLLLAGWCFSGSPALAEKRVGLIEEKNGTALIGGIEHAAKIFFGFADVFVDHAAEIDAEQVQLELAGEDLGSHGFSSSRRSENERVRAARDRRPALTLRIARLAEGLLEPFADERIESRENRRATSHITYRRQS